MRYAVIEDFFGQEVEIVIVGKTFIGILEKVPNSETEVSVIPSQKHVSERYGAAILETQHVRSIRLMKPFVPGEPKDYAFKTLPKYSNDLDKEEYYMTSQHDDEGTFVKLEENEHCK